jgi:hypothetical protein
MADDGVRLRIDGQFMLDEWHDSTQETYQFDVYLASGEHTIQVDYYENLGGARVFVNWVVLEAPVATPQASAIPTLPPSVEPTSPSAEVTAPAETPLPTPVFEPGWQAQYFDNIALAGVPVLRRNDLALDFDWGTGSPGPGVPADDFSVRWTRQTNMASGSYRFYLQADDGARVWLDGQLLIDAWPASIGETYVAEAYVPSGTHLFEVEYFEVTIDALLRYWSEAVP